MNIFVTTGSPQSSRAGCIVVGVAGGMLDPAAAALDAASRGALAAAGERGDLEPKAGHVLMLHAVAGLDAERVLLVERGRSADFDDAAYRKAVTAAVRALRAAAAAEAHLYLTQVPPKGRDTGWAVRQAATIARDESYRMDAMRGAKARAELPKVKLAKLGLAVETRERRAADTALRQALALAEGIDLTKTLGNLPPNVCTPSHLASEARALAARHRSVKVKVLDRPAMEKLGMGSFMAVAQGSKQPPKLIVLEYLAGPKAAAPIALVGKGITFDTGGISIKPSDKMDEMKFDMCGGASVLGTFEAVARLKLPLNLVGVVPACENMPGGGAVKPGDIVTSMAGITIEILNTDAEGRLILCDALTYVERTYKPSQCIDIATLTGAIVVALGGFPTGLFANDDALADALLKAGADTGDRAWRMPLWEDYQSLLKSEHADVANIAGRDGGAITAASFLHRFTRRMKWAHLDVAATAWKGKRATGRPVPLLVQYLLDQAAR